jgi:2-polyprenyl-6-methoxyphenol hydroxylase-like FAD-dependent oxidoreductase
LSAPGVPGTLPRSLNGPGPVDSGGLGPGERGSVARIVVVGAGVAGLGTALCATRSGHEVTLVERDDTPLPADPHGAFDWDRRGAPQVRHSHAFLARLRNLLRDRHPDVLAALFAAGATEMDFIEMLPEGMDRTRLPGDEDLVAIACRRTTFEWVLRRTVLDDGAARLVHGRAVTALRAADRTEPVPRVDGVVLDDGTVLDAEVVVLAGGRRADVPALLAPLGVEVAEEVEDTGIIYLSRFFALRDGAELPVMSGPIGGDLGYLKYGVFVGDNRTFSVTLAVGTDDRELRTLLLDPEQFLRVAAALPATSAYVEADRAVPITGVEVMAGLINRRRRFLDDDGDPLVLGVHAVGDAHTATNPLYGRGCSLALVQAQLLCDTLDEFGPAGQGNGDVSDHDGRARAYESATRAEITPWYRAAVTQDRLTREAARDRAHDGVDGPESHDDAPNTTDGSSVQADFARSLMRDGLFPAMRVDPVVLRAFLRMFNLLEPPDSLMADADVVGRVMAVYQDKDNRPPEPDLGPDRADLLASL